MNPAVSDDLVRHADMFVPMGTESRVRIMRQLVSSHAEGMVVGEISGPRLDFLQYDWYG